MADLGEWCAHNLYYDKVILEYHQPADPLSGWVHIQIRPKSYDSYHDMLVDDAKHQQWLKKDSPAFLSKENRMQVYEKTFNQPYERVM